MTTSNADWPKWLKDASTLNAVVTIDSWGYVRWYDGEWYDGEWHRGEWYGGEWYDGEWHGGEWRGGQRYGGEWHGGEWHGGEWNRGVWHGGIWHGGEWYDGVWHGGEWHGGVWHGGEWNRGEWHDGVWNRGKWHGGIWHDGEWYGGTWLGLEDRLKYMASFLGIVPDAAGRCVAYRTTHSDGRGRMVSTFIQPEGHYTDPTARPAGSGVCVPGIHVTSASHAWTYFGIDPTCQFWRVTFHIDDLLDCDGKKARIRGGVFERIERPF